MSPNQPSQNSPCAYMRTRAYLLFLWFGLIGLGFGCLTTQLVQNEQTSEENGVQEQTDTSEAKSTLHEDTATTPGITLLDQTRSSLKDQFPKEGLTVPEPYTLEIPGTSIEEADPFAGFRVQIYSTRQVLEADSVKDQFRVLSDSLFTGYQPEAYIRFRSPYYRVRVGDFSSRERAITLSGLLKSWYPDAWVVYEQIEPSRVPADSVAIRLRTPSTP